MEHLKQQQKITVNIKMSNAAKYYKCMKIQNKKYKLDGNTGVISVVNSGTVPRQHWAFASHVNSGTVPRQHWAFPSHVDSGTVSWQRWGSLSPSNSGTALRQPWGLWGIMRTAARTVPSQHWVVSQSDQQWDHENSGTYCSEPTLGRFPVRPTVRQGNIGECLREGLDALTFGEFRCHPGGFRYPHPGGLRYHPRDLDATLGT